MIEITSRADEITSAVNEFVSSTALFLSGAEPISSAAVLPSQRAKPDSSHADARLPSVALHSSAIEPATLVLYP